MFLRGDRDDAPDPAGDREVAPPPGPPGAAGAPPPLRRGPAAGVGVMDLNHHRVEQLLSAYVDGELTQAEARAVEEHLLDCGACRRAYEDLRATKALLGALPVSGGPGRAVAAPAGLAARLGPGRPASDPRLGRRAPREGDDGPPPRDRDRGGPLRARARPPDERRAPRGPRLPRPRGGGCRPGAGGREPAGGGAQAVRPLLLRLLAAAAVVSGAGGAVLLPASGTSGIGAAARQVLEMALAAPRLIDYEGTKVITVLRNGRTETVTVAESHKRPDMMRLEYLSPEGVAGRIIVDNGRVAWHYEPRLNMAFKDDTLQRGLLGRDLTLLFRNYRVSVLGTDEVIGRQAYVIALDPKGPGVRRELWVDRATGTVLRSEERDPGRGVVLSSYFSRISFSLNLPEAYFRYRVPAGARVFTLRGTEDQSLSPAALARRVRFPVLIPPVLPEGYTFRGGGISRFGSLTSVYLRYSDGDNAISFFEAPAGSIGWPAFGNPVRVNGQPGRYIDLGYFRVLIWEQEGLPPT